MNISQFFQKWSSTLAFVMIFGWVVFCLWTNYVAKQGLESGQPAVTITPVAPAPQKPGQQPTVATAQAAPALDGVRAEIKFQIRESRQREFGQAAYHQGVDDQAKREGIKVWTTEDAERILREEVAKMRAKVMNDP